MSSAMVAFCVLLILACELSIRRLQRDSMRDEGGRGRGPAFWHVMALILGLRLGAPCREPSAACRPTCDTHTD